MQPVAAPGKTPSATSGTPTDAPWRPGSPPASVWPGTSLPASIRLLWARVDPTQDVKLVSYTWSKEGFDTVMVLNPTIKNTGKLARKDFHIVRQVSGRSGTVLASTSPATTMAARRCAVHPP